MKYFTGIDVSLRSVSICVVDASGELQYEAKVAAELDVIVATLRRFGGEIKQVGFEAGALTQYLTYGLSQAGFEVICMEARQVAASLAAMRNTLPCIAATRLKAVNEVSSSASSTHTMSQSPVGERLSKPGASMVRYECERCRSVSNASSKMRVGPSKSACRSGLQITSSCAGQESAW